MAMDAQPLATIGQYTELTGSASANNTDLIASTDVRAYKSWSLQLTGAFTATVQVQGSNDNTNWFAIPGSQAAGTTTFTPSQSWQNTGVFIGPVVARYMRVRTTTYSSGTVTGTLELTAEPNPLLSSYIGNSGVNAASGTSGTGLLGVAEMYYDGTNYQRVAPGAGLPITGGYTELTGSASANNTDLIASTDVRAYKSFSIQFTGTFSATVQVQGSNDNTNWSSLPIQSAITAAPTVLTNGIIAANTIYIGTVPCRYVRVRTTSYTSGTVTATLELTAEPTSLMSTYVNNAATVVGGYLQTLVATGGSIADGQSTGGANMLPVHNFGYNGSSLDRLRVPVIFKTATATASGDTALWTPTTGKKFRLLRYQIVVPADAAISGGGDLDIVLRDATTGLAAATTVYAPSSAGTGFGAYDTGWIDLGNGILSAAANNVLNINLSAALTAGKVRVVCCGTEE